MTRTGRNFLFFSLWHSKHTFSHCGSDGLLAREHYILVTRPGAKPSLRGCRVCIKQRLVIAPVCFVERTATRCCAKRRLPHYIIMISNSKNCRGCHHSFPIRLHFSMRGGCFLYSKHTLGDLGKPEPFRKGFEGLSNSKTGRVFRILIVIYFWNAVKFLWIAFWHGYTGEAWLFGCQRHINNVDHGNETGARDKLQLWTNVS